MIVEVPISSALSQITLSVRIAGRQRARARIWIGAKVLRLGAAIIGTDIFIDLGKTVVEAFHTHESCARAHERAVRPSIRPDLAPRG